MLRCSHCAGFVPPAHATCPHCDTACATPQQHWLRKSATRAATAAAVMMSLMACYGGGPDDYGYGPVNPPECPYGVDADGNCLPQQPNNCGNGVLDLGEQCDDGNHQLGDGCSAGCRLESCGIAHTLNLGSNAGSTALGSQLFHSDCGSHYGFGQEQVYAFTPERPGVLTLTVDNGHTMYATISCDDVSSVNNISSTDGITPLCAAPGEPLEVPVGPSWSVWIFVEAGDNSAAGAYQLDANFTPDCGNGFIHQGYEQCDPGDAPDAGACSDTCELDTVAYGEQAAELVVGSNEGNSADGLYANQGLGCWGNDKLYSFVAPSDGTLSITATAAFDISLKLIDGDADLLDGGPCLNETLAGGSEVLTAAPSAGEQLWLVVDGYGAVDSGSYTLDVQFSPVVSP